MLYELCFLAYFWAAWHIVMLSCLGFVVEETHALFLYVEDNCYMLFKAESSLHKNEHIDEKIPTHPWSLLMKESCYFQVEVARTKIIKLLDLKER